MAYTNVTTECFINTPLTRAMRSAVKQIAAIEETSMAVVIQRAIGSEVAKFSDRIGSLGVRAGASDGR